MQITTRSVEETLHVGEALGTAAAELLRAEPTGDGVPIFCIALDGQLGAGKTQLTRGIAAGAAVEDLTLVSSPTYVLMNVYAGPLPVYHLDAYRIASEEDFAAIGFEDMLAGDLGAGIVVVEWSDRVLHLLPDDRLHVQLEHAPAPPDDELDGAGTARTITFEPTGPRARQLLSRVTSLLPP